jgi:hypothetical protein
MPNAFTENALVEIRCSRSTPAVENRFVNGPIVTDGLDFRW